MIEQSRAVIWDVDGTLIDSAEYHWLAWRDTLAAERFELTRERFQASFGQRNDTVLRGYFGEGITAADTARIAHAKEERYRDLMRTGGIQPLPGVDRWLDQLKAGGWRQAIASSAPRENLGAILIALGREGFFDAVVSAEEIEHGKPAPDIFLRAAEKIGTPPARCIVVEDAPAGVEGARRAGMRCIGVLTSHDRLAADLVVPSLEALPVDAWLTLLG
jgi:beta-phosphoglucomutase